MVMKTYNIFFGYSPLHKYILENVDAITKKTDIVISPFDLDLGCDVIHIKLEKINRSATIKQKVKSLIKLVFQILFKKCNIFIACNELSPIALLIILFCRPTEIWVCDEGNVKLNRQKEADIYSYRKKFLIKKILTLGLIKNRYSNRKITHVYTYYPEVIESILNQHNINNNVIINDLTHLELIRGDKKDRGRTLIVTSPLSENGNSKYPLQEIKILEKLIKSNGSHTFVLKPHYRENLDKYTELIQRYSNISMISENQVPKPINEISEAFKIIVGFHSTALDYFVREPSCKIISLSGFVKTQHSSHVTRQLHPKVTIAQSYCIKDILAE